MNSDMIIQREMHRHIILRFMTEAKIVELS